MEFTFDDKKQTIMGQYVEDPQAYQDIKDGILYNVFEGWEPTIDDVKRAIYDYYHPSEFSKESFREVYGDSFDDDDD